MKIIADYSFRLQNIKETMTARNVLSFKYTLDLISYIFFRLHLPVSLLSVSVATHKDLFITIFGSTLVFVVGTRNVITDKGCEVVFDLIYLYFISEKWS